MLHLDEEMLAKMRCPVSGASLVRIEDSLVSTDSACRRRYPIQDGIPILLADRAEVLGPEVYCELMKKAADSSANTAGQ